MNKIDKDILAGIRCLLRGVIPDATDAELNLKIIIMIDELTNSDAVIKEEKLMELLTYRQVAERLKIVPMTVRRLVERGHLVKVNIGRAVRVTEESLEKYLREISQL